jgi:hypothetical protein
MPQQVYDAGYIATMSQAYDLEAIREATAREYEAYVAEAMKDVMATVHALLRHGE